MWIAIPLLIERYIITWISNGGDRVTKPWVKYVIYISLLLLIGIMGSYIGRAIEENEHYPVLIYILRMVFYGAMGMVLGLDHLLRELKKDGIWKPNMSKIIAMGVPSLYISLSNFIYYNDFINTFLSFLIPPIRVMIRGNFDFLNIYQLILGYVISTSFYRYRTASENK